VQKTRWVALMSTVATVALGCGPAMAQDVSVVDEIIVTAQKRSEPLSKVPVSVAAQTQEQLDAKGVKAIEDLARMVPSLNTRKGEGGDFNISIRGVLANVGAATTGVYLDEAPVASRYACFYCGFSAFPRMFDLERVEVLRGPQGTLFGAGSEGGTIRFITPSPGLTDYSGYARAEVATTNSGAPSYEIGAAVGGPIVEDKLGFRASLWTRKDGGYIDRLDQVTGRVEEKDSNKSIATVGRVALTWKLTDELSITPSLFYQRTKVDDHSFYWPAAGELRSLTAWASPANDRQLIGSIIVAYEMGDYTFKSITSQYDRLQKRADDYTGIDLAYFVDKTLLFLPELPNYRDTSFLDTDQDTFSQEIRLSNSGTGRIALTVGAYYSEGTTEFRQAIRGDFEALLQTVYGASSTDIFGYPAVDGVSYRERQHQKDREYAAFGDLAYALTDNLKLGVGLRVSRSEFTLNMVRDGPQAGGPFAARRTGKETPVTPKFSLSYQKGDLLVYGSASKGFRTGGGNSSVANIPSCAADVAALGGSDVPGEYDSDSVWSYEAGAKGRFRGGRVSASAFWVDWSNIQTNIILPTCGYNYTANVGKAVSRGFEIEGSFQPFEGVTLNAAVGYTDAYNKSDVKTGSSFLIHSGSKLAVPDWTVALGAQYDFSVMDVPAFARADYQYTSGYTRGYVPGDISYSARINDIDAQNVVSLRLGVRPGRAEIALFANNLFDERPVIFRYEDLPGGVAYRETSIRPRTIGVSVQQRF